MGNVSFYNSTSFEHPVLKFCGIPLVQNKRRVLVFRREGAGVFRYLHNQSHSWPVLRRPRGCVK